MDVKINITGEDILKKIETLTDEQYERAMKDLVLDMQNDVIEKAYEKKSKYKLKRTNRLKGDIVKHSKVTNEDGNLKGEIKATVEYAEYVEHGSGIYSDEHRGGARKKYLGKVPAVKGKTFKNKKGKEYVNKHGFVMVKGQKPKHFMLETSEEYEPKILKYFKLKK